MKVKEIVNEIDNGKFPVIKFNKTVEQVESNLDQNMIGKIVSYQKHSDGSSYMYYILRVDLNDNLSHNKSVAKANYYDEKDDPVLTVFDTSILRGNVAELYIMPDDDIGERYESLVFNEWWGEYIKDMHGVTGMIAEAVKEVAESAWNAAKENK